MRPQIRPSPDRPQFGLALSPGQRAIKRPTEPFDELCIRDKPLIGHWVVDLLKTDFVETICIISNAHFYNQFEQWYNQLEEKSRIVLLNDGSTSNETRLGAGKYIPTFATSMLVTDVGDMIVSPTSPFTTASVDEIVKLL